MGRRPAGARAATVAERVAKHRQRKRELISQLSDTLSIEPARIVRFQRGPQVLADLRPQALVPAPHRPKAKRMSPPRPDRSGEPWGVRLRRQLFWETYWEAHNRVRDDCSFSEWYVASTAFCNIGIPERPKIRGPNWFRTHRRILHKDGPVRIIPIARAALTGVYWISLIPGSDLSKRLCPQSTRDLIDYGWREGDALDRLSVTGAIETAL